MATAQVSQRKRKAISRAQQTSEEQIQERIKERAYQLFLERGSEHGRDLEDWLRAEAEMLSIRNSLAA
jgi:hypothetical protein